MLKVVVVQFSIDSPLLFTPPLLLGHSVVDGVNDHLMTKMVTLMIMMTMVTLMILNIMMTMVTMVTLMIMMTMVTMVTLMTSMIMMTMVTMMITMMTLQKRDCQYQEYGDDGNTDDSNHSTR